MIEYISGQLTELTPTQAVIEAAGVGYGLSITLTTYDVLNAAGLGSKVKLLTEEIIREDAHVLYGFDTKRERELFRHLTSVAGVGAASARLILSALPPADFESTVANGDAGRLKSVKGIGAKTAQRILVDLRDKIKPTGEALTIQPMSAPETYEEALTALVTLGFPRPRSQKVLEQLFKENGTLTAEQAIKRALPMM